MAKRLATLNKKRCVACGECEYVCPRGAIKVYKGKYAKVDSSLCVSCTLCARNCIAGCIKMEVL